MNRGKKPDISVNQWFILTKQFLKRDIERRVIKLGPRVVKFRFNDGIIMIVVELLQSILHGSSRD